MSAIPPIEPALPTHSVNRLRRRQSDEEHERERRFDEPESEEQEPDDDGKEGDDRPHVDVRA